MDWDKPLNKSMLSSSLKHFLNKDTSRLSRYLPLLNRLSLWQSRVSSRNMRPMTRDSSKQWKHWGRSMRQGFVDLIGVARGACQRTSSELSSKSKAKLWKLYCFLNVWNLFRRKWARLASFWWEDHCGSARRRGWTGQKCFCRWRFEIRRPCLAYNLQTHRFRDFKKCSCGKPGPSSPFQLCQSSSGFAKCQSLSDLVHFKDLQLFICTYLKDFCS